MIRIFINSPIFSNVKCTYYKSDKYRTVKENSYHRCSLVPFLFTPPLPSNPIYHQLSQRECFLYLVAFPIPFRKVFNLWVNNQEYLGC